MPVIAIIGAHWGDEGKGKIVDLLAEQADMVMRFSGGDNAGHTVVNQQGEFALHLVPSGIFSPKATSVIGNGVVVNPRVLLDELGALKQRGVDTSRFFISDRAHLVMPYHILLDGLEEEARGGKAIGTTRKGIGPAFADKASRLGLRTSDLLDKDVFRERLHAVLTGKNTLLTKVYNADPLSEDEIFDEYCRYGEILAPHICDTSALLEKAVDDGKKVMLEGAQGALLDPDFGTYPYATSSSPLAGGGCLGVGLGPTRIDDVLGVLSKNRKTSDLPVLKNDFYTDLIKYRLGNILNSLNRCLVLHGQKDEWVPVEHAYNIYQRLREPKTLDIIPGADHRFSDNHRRQQAIERTVTFFRQYLQ